jgi:hypothetical protein
MVALPEEIEIEIRAPNGKLEWKLVVPAAPPVRDVLPFGHVSHPR